MTVQLLPWQTRAVASTPTFPKDCIEVVLTETPMCNPEERGAGFGLITNWPACIGPRNWTWWHLKRPEHQLEWPSWKGLEVMQTLLPGREYWKPKSYMRNSRMDLKGRRPAGSLKPPCSTNQPLPGRSGQTDVAVTAEPVPVWNSVLEWYICHVESVFRAFGNSQQKSKVHSGSSEMVPVFALFFF